MNLTRKTSPGTSYKMESSGPKVLSRYLRGPTGSCHDHCKYMISTQPVEPKTLNSFPKRVPKPPADRRVVDADHSVNKLKKAHSVVPIAPTRTTNVKNNKLVKDEGLKRDGFKISTKKDVASEPKSRDLKPKSQVSRTSGRRHSDIFQPNEDVLIPLRVPKRRLSDVGSRSNNASLVRGSSISKNESRKDSKLHSAVNKKSNSSLKTIVSSPKPSAKVMPPLRSYRSLPKPELNKGSRKLKPTKTVGLETVPEKTLHGIQRTKSQIPISSTSYSSSGEKVIRHNRLQKSCSSLMEDHSPAKDGQDYEKITDFEDKTEKMVGKLVAETIESQIPISSTSSSLEEKVITCNELHESCSPSMEDNTPPTDDQYDDKIADLEDKNANEVGKLMVETTENQIPISSPSSSSEEKIVTQECPLSMEDDTSTTDGQNDDTIEDSEDKSTKNEVGKLVVETTESEIPISSASSSSSEEKIITQECPPSLEDDGQNNDTIEDSEDKNTEDANKVENLVVETTESQIPISSASSSSSEEKIIIQECPPSMEDDGQNNDTIEDSEDKSTEDANEVGMFVVEATECQIPISPASSSSSEEKIMTQECPPSMEDDGQNNDTVEDSEDKSTEDANKVGKLVVETEDLSLGELRFRRGKVVSPQSEDSSPRKVLFRQGKELEENESEKGENKSLRRMSSDGVLVMSPEISHAISVDLKHQDLVEKKDPSEPLNKMIEETARKLIETRKSKVKALVGAFENITW